MFAWVTGLALILLMTPSAFAADSLTVAVAASFKRPFSEIARSFEAGHPIKIDASFASTGTLHSQIVNGALYDVFLAADEKLPQVLHEKGLAETPVIYARGRVVLWTNREHLCKAADWKSAIRDAGVRKVAIASPATAPYGMAAESALRKEGLWEAVKLRIVYAQDAGQAFQYVYTGAAAAGFCALSDAVSAVGREGCRFDVEEAPPVEHSACVLKRAKNREAARLFIKFLESPQAEKIKEEYGYR
ncbi:molybdate ABC transporter substrate-binding protein [bacterium]|nr:molybdate ABC transporter substrate-binding protein [bacterium]